MQAGGGRGRLAPQGALLALRSLQQRRHHSGVGCPGLAEPAGAERLAPPPAGSPTDPAHNAAVARYLLQEVRAEVARTEGYLGAPNLSTSVGWAYLRDDQARCEAADAETLRIILANENDPEAFETDEARLGERAWGAKAHYCGDLARAVSHHARTLGQVARPVGTEPYHGFALVGEHAHSEALPPSMSDWPAHLTVCDAWAGIACPAADYPQRFRETMAQWAADGVMVRLNTTWVAPDSAQWIDKVLAGPYA